MDHHCHRHITVAEGLIKVVKSLCTFEEQMFSLLVRCDGVKLNAIAPVWYGWVAAMLIVMPR